MSVEARSAVLTILACNTGGPTEGIVDDPPSGADWRLWAPEAPGWVEVLYEMVGLLLSERSALADRARAPAREHPSEHQWMEGFFGSDRSWKPVCSLTL